MPDNVIANADSAPRAGFGSEIFWRLLAAVIFLSVLWILWLLWQITPRPTVNPIVFQIQQSRQSASGMIQRPSGDGQSSDVAQTPTSGTPSPLTTGTPLENLKIDTQLREPNKPEPAK